MERQQRRSPTDEEPTQPQECITHGRPELENQAQHDDGDWDYIRLHSNIAPQTFIAHTPSIAWYEPVPRFWRNHVRISVPHASCRDHLANERTFLGYLRSSLILSVMGVLVAQLYRVQHAPHPDAVFGFYVLSTPIAVILHTSALAVVLVGAHRFLRQQSAMVRGKIHAGGWEVVVVGTYTLLLLIGLFAVHIGVSAYKSTK